MRKSDPAKHPTAAAQLRLEALERLTQDLMKTAELIAAEVAGLRTLLASSSDENPSAAWKRPSGRLTDEGIAAINTALETGLSVTEISRRFEISQSAASQRKQVWLASRAKGG